MTQQTATAAVHPPPGQEEVAPVTITRREPRPAPEDPVIVGIGPAFRVRYAPGPCHDCGRPVERGSIGRVRLVARGPDLLVHASCVGLDEWTATLRSSVKHERQQ